MSKYEVPDEGWYLSIDDVPVWIVGDFTVVLYRDWVVCDLGNHRILPGLINWEFT